MQDDIIKIRKDRLTSKLVQIMMASPASPEMAPDDVAALGVAIELPDDDVLACYQEAREVAAARIPEENKRREALSRKVAGLPPLPPSEELKLPPQVDGVNPKNRTTIRRLLLVRPWILDYPVVVEFGGKRYCISGFASQTAADGDRSYTLCAGAEVQ